MVSEWMPNDNVREYVLRHPQVNRMKLVSTAKAVAGSYT
jgi:hypothetical protein